MGREANPIEVAVVSEGGLVTARGDVLELSATGASIGTHQSVAVGPVLRFRLKFPDSRDNREILGRVMWAQDAVFLPGSYSARLNVKWLRARLASDEASAGGSGMPGDNGGSEAGVQ
jgi:hypothetical protein